MSTSATGVATTTRSAPWAFGYWALVGALVGFTVAGALSIGVYSLALAVVLTLVGLRVPRLRGRATVAIVAGLGVAPLWIAWLNRGGPGEVCTTTATSTSCVDAWSPWPFVLVGLVFVVGGVLLARRAQASASRQSSSASP